MLITPFLEEVFCVIMPGFVACSLAPKYCFNTIKVCETDMSYAKIAYNLKIFTILFSAYHRRKNIQPGPGRMHKNNILMNKMCISEFYCTLTIFLFACSPYTNDGQRWAASLGIPLNYFVGLFYPKAREKDRCSVLPLFFLL